MQYSKNDAQCSYQRQNLFLIHLNCSIAYTSLIGNGIPSELGLLTELTELDLSKWSIVFDLQGNRGFTFLRLIISQILNCISIHIISLGETEIGGRIPSEIGLLSNLRKLDLSR